MFIIVIKSFISLNLKRVQWFCFHFFLIANALHINIAVLINIVKFLSKGNMSIYLPIANEVLLSKHTTTTLSVTFSICLSSHAVNSIWFHLTSRFLLRLNTSGHIIFVPMNPFMVMIISHIKQDWLPLYRCWPCLFFICQKKRPPTNRKSEQLIVEN